MAEVESDTTVEIRVVEAFLEALGRLDAEAALTLLDPQVAYRNVPFPAARGLPAVGKQLHGMARIFSGFAAISHNIAANGPVVLTERTDILQVGRWRAAFWVCGTFEVHDGLITSWTDRFDFADMTWAMLRGLAVAPFTRAADPSPRDAGPRPLR